MSAAEWATVGGLSGLVVFGLVVVVLEVSVASATLAFTAGGGFVLLLPFFGGIVGQLELESGAMWGAICVTVIVAGLLLGIVIVQGHGYRLRKLELDTELAREV